MKSLDDLRQNIGLQRSGAAQLGSREGEPLRATPNTDKASFAFLYDLAASRPPARSQPYMAAPQRGMARKGQLARGRKDANAIVRTGRPRLQEEGRLAEVRPVGERCHLRGG